jgi:YtcA family
MKILLGDRGAYRAVPAIIAEWSVMRWRPSIKSIVRGPLLASALSGCAVRGAPSFVIAGSYFPGWMFCALVGIVLAIAVRIGFVTSGLASVLPLQLFVCSAIGLCCGLLAWLLWFGQ